MHQDTLVIEQPAIRWDDALPSGNGHVGAMVYGGIHRECILLNHEALWLPLFSRPALPNMAPHLAEYRRLLEAHQFPQADAFWRTKLKEEGWPDLIYTNPFHPAFDLRLTQEVQSAFTHYQRRLDMTTGEVITQWEADGVTYRRRLFVSRADQVVVLQIDADRKGQIHLDAELAPHPMFEDSRKTVHYPRPYKPEEIPLHYKSHARGHHLSIDARYSGYATGDGFGGLAKVIHRGGTLRALDNALSIRGATEVLVFIHVHPRTITPAVSRRIKSVLDSLPADYPRLLSRHVKQHRELYARLRLKIADTNATTGEQSNDVLLAAAYRHHASNILIERLCNFGRYLLISSTAADGLPPNAQGLWNGDYIPAWSGDYTIDENVEMNHWQALAGNLPELMQPYFSYFESTLEDWKANAKAFYGCRGAMAPLRQSDNGLMSENMPYLIWTAGAGWIARLFYEYFLYTGDRQFLKNRAVPFLKQAALFYEDFLYQGPDGKLVCCPSMSPENIPDIANATRPSVNPTMDFAVCREVLTSLISACELLEIELASVRRYKALLTRLPEYEINADGAIKEWQHPGLNDNYHHRHLSHLYGLFPGSEITREQTPELFRACHIAVEKRLVVGLKSQTSWSLAHMANLYARLGEGDRALECFDLIARSCTGPNLLTYHNDWRTQGITLNEPGFPPFQIDANLGLSAAALEMLVFSRPRMIKLLPALPTRWQRGQVQGLQCRGQIELGITWDRTKPELLVQLRSRLGQSIALLVPPWIGRIMRNGRPITPQPGTADGLRMVIDLPRGKLVQLRGKA